MKNCDPKIGVAFGGGGAKGLSQIGVMKVFEKYDIEISSVAGTSAGSIIGGAVALGHTSDEILDLAKAGVATKKMTKIRNINFFSSSLIKDKVINRGIQEMLGEKTFEDVKIPYLATAVDLESGEEVILKEGKLWEAARASSAIPFVLNPYFLNGQYLIDGGLLNNVPVDKLREQKDINLVIGIELGGMATRQYISGMIWDQYYRKPKTFAYYPSFLTRWRMNTNLMTHVLLRSLDILREKELRGRYKKAAPDIIIKPRLESVSLLDFGKYEEAIEAGINAAEEVMPKLLKLIEKRKQQNCPELVKRQLKTEEKSGRVDLL